MPDTITVVVMGIFGNFDEHRETAGGYTPIPFAITAIRPTQLAAKDSPTSDSSIAPQRSMFE